MFVHRVKIFFTRIQAKPSPDGFSGDRGSVRLNLRSRFPDRSDRFLIPIVVEEQRPHRAESIGITKYILNDLSVDADHIVQLKVLHLAEQPPSAESRKDFP